MSSTLIRENIEAMQEYCLNNPTIRRHLERNKELSVYATFDSTLMARMNDGKVELYIFTGGAGERRDDYVGIEQMTAAWEKDNDLAAALVNRAKLIEDINRRAGMERAA